MKTMTNAIATIACTLVMSATLIGAAIAPAGAAGTTGIASPPAIVA